MATLGRIRPARALALAVVAFASTARAQEAPPPAGADPRRPHWELAGVLGYTAPPIHGGTTPFGLGYGARLAYAPSSWVVGVSVVRFAGGDDYGSTNSAWRYGAEVGRGFAFPLSSRWSFVLRPRVGVGGVTIIHTDPSDSSSTASTTSSNGTRPRSVSVVTDTDVITAASVRSSGSSSSSIGGIFGASADSTVVSSYYIEPGLTLLLTTGVFYMGVDASMLVLPAISYGGAEATTWLTYGMSAQLGVMF